MTKTKNHDDDDDDGREKTTTWEKEALVGRHTQRETHIRENDPRLKKPP